MKFVLPAEWSKDEMDVLAKKKTTKNKVIVFCDIYLAL